MNSIRIMLLAAVMIIGSSNGKQYSNCELELLHSCDKGFVDDFHAHWGYCNVFQRFADCLSSWTECEGKFVDSYRYMILQRMIMDKTLELCPQHDLEAFKNVVTAHNKYRIHIENLSGIDEDDFAPCAADIHRKCATDMQTHMEGGVKMCTSIKKFIECYENPEESCNAKIYKKFVQLLRKFASQMLKMYKKTRGVMPEECE